MDLLPYKDPFLFVDCLEEVTENSAKGLYRFPEDAFYYRGHFPGNPVTPGVILTECCAQIGVVSLGIYLLMVENADGLKDNLQLAFTRAEIDFLAPVYPGEQVRVVSEKIYFRFNKLKVHVKMTDLSGKLLCKGILSGMLKSGNAS